MSEYYLLKDKEVRAVDEDEYHAATKEERSGRLFIDKIEGYFISTIFLGQNYDFLGIGSPLVFETMVFKGENFNKSKIEGNERYSTYEQAEEGHKQTVKKYLNKIKKGK